MTWRLAIDAAAGVAAALLVFGYVCRLDLLRVGSHRLGWIALHMGMAGSAFQVLVNAVYAGVDLQDGFCLLAAGSWIVISAAEWREGVPREVQSAPMPLEGEAT